MDPKEFSKEDFTEEELMLLRLAFKLTSEAVEVMRYDMHLYSLSDDLYNLKNKLGIYDLVD